MTTSSANAPIALFAYNRADYATRALRALAKNPELASSPLFVFCDGAKSEAGRAKVDATRKAVREHAPAHATIVERETNFGLAKSIRTGVTELCTKFGRAIVFEDDLEPSSTCLRFFNDALDRYADSDRVMQISGYMWPVDVGGEDDALFLPLISCWGWAVWQRSWAKLDSGQGHYERLERDPALRKRFDLEGAFPYFDMLRSQKLGEIDSWAVRWLLDVFANDGLVLFPRQSLIANRGHDGSGTHREEGSPFESDAHDVLPQKMPAREELDPAKVRALSEFVRDASRGSIRNRAGRMLLRARSAAKARTSGASMQDMVWPMLRAARVPQLVSWALAKYAHERCLRVVRAGEGVKFGATARVHNPRGREHIVVGDRTLIDGELLVHDYGGSIKIGSDCYIGMETRVWSGEQLEIGNHVFIAHNTTIVDTNAHQVDAGERAAHYQRTVVEGRPFEKGSIATSPVVIEDHAWINFNVAILKGVRIGEGAIIGAGSVVTKDVPPYVLCAGNPAQVIRALR